MADGFLGRWSQRKMAVKSGQVVEDAPPLPEPATPSASALPEPSPPAAVGIWGQPNFHAYGAPASSPEVTPPSSPEAVAPAPETAPTLEDAQQLTPESDFKPYMSARVSPDVRNAAMKKLFADPHFNVMDGLDIYIDDYTQPDPLPASMLRQMASANFLGLFDEEKTQAAQPPESTPLTPEASCAPGTLSPSEPDSPPQTPPQDDHPDL